MNGVARTPVCAAQASLSANGEDLGRFLIEDLSGLYQLSFLLTGDHKKAEKCLVGGIEDSVSGNRGFKEWARSWAKLIIIENAIRELKPRLHSFGRPAVVSSYARESSAPGEHFALGAVLGLQDFERFVFVMSVLEHYSLHDCALLLGCLSSEVREAQQRALQTLAATRHVSFTAKNSQINEGRYHRR